MRKIMIVTADRAERGLLNPVFLELAKNEQVIPVWCELDSKWPPDMNLMVLRDLLLFNNPDIVVVPCDRNEMVYAAAFAFQNNYVVAHFHAGNNNTNHPDDFNRRAISLYSHILLCNMAEHKENLIKQGEEEWRIHVVGSTAFDSLIFDESITPKHPFTLVVLHPDPTSAEKTYSDINATLAELGDRDAIWLYPNKDKNHELIVEFLNNLNRKNITKYIALPRFQYLNLLKECEHAIGNSSSFYYELPVVNPNAIFHQIGERNKGLTVPKTEVNGSKRIADLLATIELTEKLRTKRMT